MFYADKEPWSTGQGIQLTLFKFKLVCVGIKDLKKVIKFFDKKNKLGYIGYSKWEQFADSWLLSQELIACQFTNDKVPEKITVIQVTKLIFFFLEAIWMMLLVGNECEH